MATQPPAEQIQEIAEAKTQYTAPTLTYSQQTLDLRAQLQEINEKIKTAPKGGDSKGDRYKRLQNLAYQAELAQKKLAGMRFVNGRGWVQSRTQVSDAEKKQLQSQIDNYQSQQRALQQKINDANIRNSLIKQAENLNYKIKQSESKDQSKFYQSQREYKSEMRAIERLNMSRGTEQFKSDLYDYRGTDYGSTMWAQQSSNPDKEQAKKEALHSARQEFLLIQSMAAKGYKGGDINRALAEQKFYYMGGTKSEWQAKVQAEDLNRKLALRQSAGLRASGNAQIKTAQNVELQRLGGSSTSGPTMVSNTITTNRVPTAPGVAAKAQDFPSNFLVNKPAPTNTLVDNQKTLDGLGVNVNVKSLDELGISSIYNQTELKPSSIRDSTKITNSIVGGNADPWTVTTPDGKTRTFKDKATADKFISRIQGSYTNPLGYSGGAIQGPLDLRSQQTWQITTLEKGKLPTLTGSYETLVPKTRTFTSEKSANLFLDRYNKSQESKVQGLGGAVDQQQDTWLGGATQKSLDALERFQTWRPKNPVVSSIKSVVDPVVGFTKENLSTLAFIGNLGTQAGAWSKGRDKPLTKPITTPQTYFGGLIENTITGKSLEQQKAYSLEYIKSHGVTGTIGEVGALVVGGGNPVKALKTLSPLKLVKYEKPGITILSNVGKEVKATGLSFGYGTKIKILATKVGDDIYKGVPNKNKLNINVLVNPATDKQLQRGVKMGADSSKFEQQLDRTLLQKTGLTPEAKRQAEIIEDIVLITTKPKKDTMVTKELGKGIFENVTPTEQPSFTGALKDAQKKIINPIEPYGGSVSGYYFTEQKYLRTIGDVDLHAPTFEKAAQQMRRIVPNIIPDPGRLYIPKISKTEQSVKLFSKKISDPFNKNIKHPSIIKTEYITKTNLPESGINLYHGTLPENAIKILRGGFDFSKSKTSKGTIFTNTNPKGSYGFTGANLKITMSKNAKTLDANSQEILSKFGTNAKSDPAIREYAKKNNYDMIKNLMQGIQDVGEEVEIISSKNILKIEPVKKILPSKVYDINQNRFRGNQIRTLSGKWINPSFKERIPITKIIERPPIKQQALTSKENTGKVIEILNPKETDLGGVLQSIEGSTIMGKKIPLKTYKVAEGKTYGRQKQILGKAESLYSIQKTDKGLKLLPAEFRYKDIADLYGLGKSAQHLEFVKGSKDERKLDALLKEFKEYYKKTEGFDIDDYLKKNAPPIKDVDEPMLTVGQSTIQKFGSNTASAIRAAPKSYSIVTNVKSIKQDSISPEKTKYQTSMLNPSSGIKLNRTSLTSKTPSLTSKAPSLISKPPSLISKPPSLISKTPSLTSNAPSLISKTPSLTSKAPSLTSKAPSLTSKAPSLTSKAPSLTSKAPSLTSKAPSLTSNAPSLGGPSLGGSSKDKPPTSSQTFGKPSSKTPGIFKGTSLDTGKRPPPMLLIWKTKGSEPKPRPTKPRHDYLGNVPTDKIEGIFGKRRETTYKESSINKALRLDKLMTTKNYKANLLRW